MPSELQLSYEAGLCRIRVCYMRARQLPAFQTCHVRQKPLSKGSANKKS